MNFIKPIANATSGGGHFPHLEFSDNQTLDNRAIKRWTYGRDETGSDSTTAYFDLVGNQTMDDTLNPGLANGLMGCVIPVPMGRSDVGFHDIDFNFVASHEGGDPQGDTPFFATWKPTIWRAYAYIRGGGMASFRVPVYSSGDEWEGKTCYYMVGFHVDLYDESNGSQPQTTSTQWPTTANPTTGLKQCSIIANFIVTYRSN
ncbi:MAG: hypothetical protein ACKVJ2_13350 [Pseudomonadales bacterium]